MKKIHGAMVVASHGRRPKQHTRPDAKDYLGPAHDEHRWVALVHKRNNPDQQRATTIAHEHHELANTPTLDLEASAPEMLEGKQGTLFIGSMEGNKICIKIGNWEEIKTLKQRIQERIGIPPCKQLLIYIGKVLQEEHKLKEYDIGNDSTIYLNTRLHGGYSGTSSKGPVSFKDAVKGKMEPQAQTE